MLDITENESFGISARYTSCVVLTGTYQNLPQMQENLRLIFVEKGICDIVASNTLFSLKENEFIFIEKKAKSSNPLLSGNNPSVWVLDFSLENTELNKYELDTNKVYTAWRINILNHLSHISAELCENTAFGSEESVSCRISLLLTDIAKSLYTITLPSHIIGENGFSVENVGDRTSRYFHGRNCIKIKANTKINSIVVLENYDIYDYKIDLKEIKYVQLNYYYENNLSEQSQFARIRFLAVKDENEMAQSYIQEKNGYPEFFAPLNSGEWNYAIFPIKLTETYLSMVESMKNAYLVQMKLDPFGMRRAKEIGEDETMYISSVTFYKKLPQNKDMEISFDPRINSVLEIMNQNISQNFDLKYYADKFFLSPSYFSEWFKNETGVSPHRYILIQKIRLAKSKLANTNAPIKSIAENCGFHDTHYFSRIFLKYSGMTPSAFRKSTRKNKA